MFYTMLGVVQFTVWEAIFVHCYATNRLPYLSDQQALSSPWNMELFLLAAFWVPLYRDGLHIYRQNVINILIVYRELHFYFAHRFIHIKAVYKYVHALHHRYKSKATINKTSTPITITITIISRDVSLSPREIIYSMMSGTQTSNPLLDFPCILLNISTTTGWSLAHILLTFKLHCPAVLDPP